MPDKAHSLDERLTRLLAGMEAQMPLKNPAFEPKANKLFNRQFTLNLATTERQAFAARLQATGLTPPIMPKTETADKPEKPRRRPASAK